MNYIKHLTGFFERVVHDSSLNATHISMYMSVFQFWNCNRFRNPISISRDEIMRISKISSKATYHKCIRELHELGYFKYEPSYNPFKGSHVVMFNFADDLKPLTKNEKTSAIFVPVDKQALNRQRTRYGTSPEQALVPSINNINISNNSKSLNAPDANENYESVEVLKNRERQKEKKLRKKKKDLSAPPALKQVLKYFFQQGYPELEASKFFNYFQSIGWRVGGKTQMVDWHAAAQNWMLNLPNLKPYDRSAIKKGVKDFDTSPSKDYAEPL